MGRPLATVPGPGDLSPSDLLRSDLLEDGVAQRSADEAARGLSARHRRLLNGSGLALADIAAIALATLFLGLVAGQGPWDVAMLPALFAAVVLGLSQVYGLYPGDRMHAHEGLRRRSFAWLGALLAIGGAMALSEGVPGGLLGAVLLAALSAVLAAPLRSLARRLLRRWGLWGTPTEFAVGAERLPVVERLFEEHWQYGLVPVPARQDGAARPGTLPGTLVATDRLPTGAAMRELTGRGRDVLVLADFPQLRLSGLRPADLGGAIGLLLRDPGTRGAWPAGKRLFDLAVAIPAMVFLAPFALLAALAIRLVDPGPLVYRQMREGLGGVPIPVLKLRTMYRDAEAMLQKVLDEDPEARTEWETHFKLRNDPRILPVVGRALRASSCDELPQILNVVARQMSLVGPRPFPDYHLSSMPPEFRRKRSTVPPGITGLWQISARSDAEPALQRQLDEFYIDNRSIWLDLVIVAGTIPALVWQRGAY